MRQDKVRNVQEHVSPTGVALLFQAVQGQLEHGKDLPDGLYGPSLFPFMGAMGKPNGMANVLAMKRSRSHWTLVFASK
jgi:hypothetical protein